jgi:hypothetical protein
MQTVAGYYHYDLLQYFKELYLITFPMVIGFTLLAFFVQTVVSNKFMGHAIVIGIFVLDPILFRFGIENTLLLPGQNTPYTYSDMNGYGHFVPALACGPSSIGRRSSLCWLPLHRVGPARRRRRLASPVATGTCAAAAPHTGTRPVRPHRHRQRLHGSITTRTSSTNSSPPSSSVASRQLRAQTSSVTSVSPNPK